MHEHEREPDTIADIEPAPTLPLPSASADELMTLIAQGHDLRSLDTLIERTASIRDAA